MREPLKMISFDDELQNQNSRKATVWSSESEFGQNLNMVQIIYRAAHSDVWTDDRRRKYQPIKDTEVEEMF